MADANPQKFETIAKGIYLEGLSVDARRGDVWYSDVIRGGIHRLSPDGSVASFNTDRMWTGGIIMNEDGSALSSGAGGIAWNNPHTGGSGMLIDQIDGQPIGGINEMIPDGSGGIYFGTVDIPAIIKGEQPSPASIYHLSVDRTVTRMCDGLVFANGITRSPDGRRLYVCETFVGVAVLDIRSDGTLGPPTRLFDKEDCDGMALDTEGNLWVTGYKAGELTRLSPDGKLLPPYATPAGGITQIRFGGADGRDVYINAVPTDAGDSLKVGVVPNQEKSFLYRGRADVAGLPIPPTKFKLS